jgi:exodeoxyribonuclease V
MPEVTILDAPPSRQAPRHLHSLSQLTPDQTAAIRGAVAWYREHQKPYFQISGLAGTGKTSIIRYIIDDLGLDERDLVLYGAYTGKAARVLSNKGLNAETLHSLCYRLVSSSKGQMTWKLNENSPIANAALLVVDECSMLNDDLLNDILSFGTPVIFLGDHGQLPPIEGRSRLTIEKPDAILEKIHRQAADNPIIRIAHDIRAGKIIRCGDYGTVRKIRRRELDTQQLLATD